MTKITNYEYDDTTYAKVSKNGIWVFVSEDMELTQDNYSVYRMTDNLVLLKKPLKSRKPFQTMKPVGEARLLKSKKYTLKFSKSVKESLVWEDGWEVFVYSNVEDIMFLACPPLDELEYLELRGLPGIISIPIDTKA